MKVKPITSDKWYNRRAGALGLVLVSLVLACAVGRRALDTGSLQQYFLTFALVIIAINRILKTVQKNKTNE